MKYYLIAPLSNSPLLTYASKIPLQKGELVQVQIKNKTQKGLVWEECQKPHFQCKFAEPIDAFFLPHQILLAHFIAQYYCTPLGKAFSIFTPTSQISSAILDTNNSPSPSHLEIQTPHKHTQSIQLKHSPLELSPEQKEALNFISQQPLSLLFGETGSGKSEVYIHLIIQALQEDKNALMLMPEISLTPQMQQRLERVFGDLVGIWHSKMSSKKRKEILERLERGEIRLILGARSALFLPIQKLGLIIVDEEHDDAYKAHNTPHYNAKDLAIYLGKKLNIKVLLGSATPSVNSYFLTFQNQTIFRLQKFFPSSNELIFLKQKSELSEEIIESIRSALALQKQVLLFLPTRANFKYLICLDCGESVKCPFCAISMSLHRNKNMMLCHYCGYSEQIPSTCPSCHNPHFYSHRIGTAQVAQELKEHFPHSHIAIFDRDHISTQHKLEKTLKDFAHQKIDILVGTQMLSKGHDYHNIGLAVILGIDEVLHFGDFRSREKAMALFFQIKGRVGRKENGKVIIQTLNPSFFDCHNYEDFLQEELKLREGLYPPFVKLATLTFSHPNEQKAQSKMQKALMLLAKMPNIQIVGGSKAKIEKIDSKYRYIILLRSKHPLPLLQALHLQELEGEIDMDPLNIV